LQDEPAAAESDAESETAADGEQMDEDE